MTHNTIWFVIYGNGGNGLIERGNAFQPAVWLYEEESIWDFGVSESNEWALVSLQSMPVLPYKCILVWLVI